MSNIFKYFPNRIREIINTEVSDKYDSLDEISIRVDKPIILKFNNSEKIIRYNINSDEILNILQLVCENSIYSYQKQISEGFVTINGGHRVGISGSCVIENGKVKNINYIYSLNLRIAKEVIGASNRIIKDIINIEENNIYNTLIASSPGARKNYNIKRFSKKFK